MMTVLAKGNMFEKLIVQALKKFVARLPFRTIETDGRPYLTRWYVWPPAPRSSLVDDGVTPKSPLAIFVHFFHRGDEARDQHNHPWAKSVSLVLVGGYREERGTKTRVVRPWSLNVIGKDDFHRVDLLEPKKGCWSIFVAGTNVQSWGFRKKETGEYVSWRRYLAKREN